MADATVAIDRLEAFQVALEFAAQVALDGQLARGDCVDDVADLRRSEVLGADVEINVGLLQDAARRVRPDAVNVRQRRFDALFSGDIDSK